MMTRNTTAYFLLIGVLAIMVVTSTHGASLPPAETYTLADFDMESVEPGFTLLSEAYLPPPFPASKVHVNGPQHVSKNWRLFYEYGSWEPVVGVLLVPPEDRDEFTHCHPTVDMKDLSGYIVAVPQMLGCSPEAATRSFKEVGATGVIHMSSYPFSGYATQFWTGLQNEDLLNYPSIQVGAFVKYYLIQQSFVGNETVVAIASGDVNLHYEASSAPISLIIWFIGWAGDLIIIVLCIYIRKKMYDFAPMNKKWERTMATTCIEIELFLNLARFPYLFGSGGEGKRWFHYWVMCGPITQSYADFENLTTVLLILYFHKMTSDNKSLSKSTSISKLHLISAVLICLPGFIVSTWQGFGFIFYNWYIIQHTLKSIGLSGDLIDPLALAAINRWFFALAFAVIYVIYSVKFLLFLRNSAKSAGSVTKDDPRVKMQRRMMNMMFASASAMVFNGLAQIIESNKIVLYISYFTPGGYLKLIQCVLISSLPVSYLQTLAFAAPILRKMNEEKLSKLKKSTKDGLSDGSKASSSVTSSSVSSSSVNSSVTSITTNTTTTTSSSTISQ